MNSSSALAGIRVLECGEFVAAAYAAKLLAHAGADVVKVEPPVGDPVRRRGPFPGGVPHPERSGLHLYLNQAKRGIVMDSSQPDGLLRFNRLVANADAVLVSGSPRSIEERELTHAALAAVNPRVVVTTITPFGMTGPRRNWAATELIEVAAGGWLYVSPGALRDPALPPLKAFGQQADFQGGVHGAIVTMGGLFARQRTGRGQHVDVSVQACIASNLEMSFVHWTYGHQVASRLGERAVSPWGIIQLADGPFFLMCVEEDQWQRFTDYLGSPEWTGWEIFADRLARAQNGEALMLLVEQALSHLTCEQAYADLQDRRIPCAPIFDMAMLLASGHLAARGFFGEVDHPEADRLTYPLAPFRFSQTPWHVRRPAPRLGEHTVEVLNEWNGKHPHEVNQIGSAGLGLPLVGVRVADFCWVWAGPACTLLLALLGADVIKVEALHRMDLTRSIPPWADDVPGPNRAGYFNQYNQQKRSIVLDLKHPQGIQVARDLVAASDVVTENFSAGVMDRLGLGYERLRSIKSDIVMLSCSSYGATGPERDYIAYGPVQVAMIGLASLSGYPGMGPSEVGLAHGDPNAGLHAAYAVLVALWHRQRTGEGQYIDLSQWEAAIGLVSEALMEYVMNGTQPVRLGNRDPIEAPQGVFLSAGEDEWVAIACWSDAQWSSLCTAMQRPDLADDRRFATRSGRKQHEGALESAITQWTQQRPPDEVVRVLQAHAVPSYRVLSNRGVAEDEQLNHRDVFADLEHAEVGVRRHAGAPWRFSGCDVRVRRPAPLFGQDTDTVLADILGYNETRIARLRASGAIS